MLGAVAKRPVCYRCQISQIQQTQQTRAATLLKRPKRPYTFTQLITLSDGSTFLHRTTSPTAVYRSTKDTKNSVMWNPSSQQLLNKEEDEAGRLKQFRARFGRGWDSEMTEQEEDGSEEDPVDSLTDLMAAAVEQETKRPSSKEASEPEVAASKSKKKKK